MTAAPPDQAWMVHAACRACPHPEAFDADRPSAETHRWCARCPVRVECRDYAIAYAVPSGVWADTGPADRLAASTHPSNGNGNGHHGKDAEVREGVRQLVALLADAYGIQPPPTCSVAGCLKRRRVRTPRDLCDTHYRRLQRAGDTYDELPVKAGGRPLADRREHRQGML